MTEKTALETLRTRKQEIKKTPCYDKRKIKGKNRYTVVVTSCFDVIEELLAKGDTLSGIFICLQEKNFFDVNADFSGFWKAFKREHSRRNPENMANVVNMKPIVTNSHRKTEPPENIQATQITKKQNIEAVEYERDGKRFVVLDGVEREIPEGYHVLRNKIRPKPVIEAKKDEEDEKLDFSKLPQYIRDSMNESNRNGTVLQDREKHDQMIAEWLESKRNNKHEGSNPN